jgi:hypothetical protein
MAAPIINDNDLKLQAARYRFTTTTVNIAGTSGAFKTPKNGAATIPASITLTATTNNVFTAAAVYTWSYALSTQPNTWIALGTGNSVNITSSSFLTALGNDATAIQYRCIVTESLLPSASGFFTVSYSKEVSDPIIVDITRTTAVIPCTSAGLPTGFTNTDTSISVSRGGVALSYSATAGVANSFSVSIVADDVARTLGTISTTSTTYNLSGITAIAVDIATVVFVVTVYDASGNAVSPTFGKKITYNKITNGLVGGDATYYYIDSTAPIISKSTSAASISGTHSNITVSGKKVVGSALPVAAGFVTVTGNGDTEATLASSSITTAINNTAGKTSYTVKLYNQATVAGATLLSTLVIPVVFTGSSAITAVLTNDSTTIPTNSSGTSGIYTGTPTEIHVYEGTTELTYDGVGTSPGTWKLATPFQSSITVGTTAAVSANKYATIGAASNIVADTAYITYKITGTTAGGLTFLLDKTQTFSTAKAGAAGTAGTPGVSGTKSITINAFQWATAIGTFVQAATYTWATGTISALPTGWTSSAPASTASGQTLFQISLTITALATDTTTAVNWSTAVSNTVGYRLDGTQGLQGNSARIAYIVTTSATPPATPTALVGDQPPTGWSYTPTATLTAGQFMYQSDGILTAGGNIAWRTPYLANLKVGSLSALSADLGTVGISTTGSLATTGKTYGNVTNGIFLGYSTDAYKFEIGPAGGQAGGNGIKWDGASLTINGNGKFTGDITGASGKFSGSLDISSNLTGPSTAVSAGQVYTVTTQGTSTLAQWKLLFSALTAIPAVNQQITATATGTLANGSTVTIAATGARLKISGDQILVYDANNILRVVLGRVA